MSSVKVTHYRSTDKRAHACGAHLMCRNTTDPAKVTCPQCAQLLTPALPDRATRELERMERNE